MLQHILRFLNRTCIANYLHMLCAILLLITHHGGNAVFIGLTSLSNKENGQQVILLSDAHQTVLEPMVKGLVSRGSLGDSVHAAFTIKCDEQCSIAPRFVSFLLNDKKSKKCLITETIGTAFCQMARLGQMEAHFGITQEAKDPEVLLCVPRLLLRHFHSLHEHSEHQLFDKDQLLGAVRAKMNYNYLGHDNVLLTRDKDDVIPFTWIVGDNRNEQEMLMGMIVPIAWPMFKELMEQKDPNLLADDSFQMLTMGFLKKDMMDCGKIFKEKGIDDQSACRLLAIINELLEKKELKETDHVVTLYDYLFQKNRTQDLRDISEDSVDCCVKKFDVELQYYLQQHVIYDFLQHRPDVTCLMAGAMHTDYVQKYLSDFGFQTDYVVGVPVVKGSDFERVTFLEQLPGKIELVNKVVQLLLNAESDTV